MSAFERSHRIRREAELRARAHALRQFSSAPEQALWEKLRGSRLGVEFRRHVVVAEFIADFAAPSAKLIGEVDGGTHALRRSRDRSRDRKLRRLGFAVLRLEAELVKRELPRAVEFVRAAVEERTAARRFSAIAQHDSLASSSVSRRASSENSLSRRRNAT